MIILLLDDARDLCKVIKEGLSDEHTVECAHRVAKARKIYDENPPDLLITDIMMPDEDGLELIRSLNETHTFNLIAMSGQPANIHSAEAFAEMKAVTYVGGIQKPFRIQELKDLINTI